MENEQKFEKALKSAENMIKKNHGSLKDLPPEFANTICNIYFKFVFFALTDPIALASSGIHMDIERVSKHIEGIRTIDKVKKPNEYNYIVQYVLDCLKYKIENAHLKSGIKRSLERKFKKKKVDEIPNLVELMDVY